MATLLQRKQRIPRHVNPDMRRRVALAEIKRCGVCLSENYTADQFTDEDGIEKCPNCVDVRTAQFKADTLSREAAYAASRAVRPQVSRKALNETMPAIVRDMEDANGTSVTQSAPLRLTRNVAKTLVLNGREFSAADVITASTGITVGVTSRTSTQTDLSLTADVAMAAGDLYSLTFNGYIYHGILTVR